MIPVIRKHLVLLLAMLQLFAPLVHAHVGNNSFGDGLHIPGLELYRPNQDAPVVHNVNLDCEPEGLLVMVDAGIKQPYAVDLETSGDYNPALLPADQLRLSALPYPSHNFSPHQPSVGYRLFSNAHSPRAPPIH